MQVTKRVQYNSRRLILESAYMSRPGSPSPAACAPAHLPPIGLPLPRVRQIRWITADLQRAWENEAAPPCPRAKAALHDSLWHSLATEYDARHLSAFLRQQPIALSPAFWAMERAWAEDEANHYRGLSFLYARLYDVSEAQIAARLSERSPDFSLLGPLLCDEFCLCVVLAFDELASTRAYAHDAVSYSALGAAARLLLRRIARDELLHCHNAIDLLVRTQARRLPEAEAVIERVIAHDTSPQFSYRATFLLDQIIKPAIAAESTGPNPYSTVGLSAEFLQDCGRRLIRFLYRAQSRINPC